MNSCYERPTIVLAAVLPALFLCAYAILGSAIGWPDSLGAGMEEQLSRVAANADAVRLGYSFYLLASAAHIGLAVLLAIHLGVARRPWLAIAALLGCVAGIFKMLGIARWLEAMPQLAIHLGDAPETTAIAFALLNDYAGVTLGEGLGVGLFTGLWFGVLALASGAPQDAPPDSDERALPLWLRVLFGITALASLTGFAGLYGVEVSDAIPMLTGYLQYFGIWFLAAALALARWQARRSDAPGAVANARVPGN